MSRNGVVARRRRNESEWRALIAEQADSGLSQRAFCEARGLPVSSLGNAIRRQAKRRSVSSALEFVPVELDAAQRSGWEIELALSDGVTLRLRRS